MHPLQDKAASQPPIAYTIREFCEAHCAIADVGRAR
jgi:hypothetical protein